MKPPQNLMFHITQYQKYESPNFYFEDFFYFFLNICESKFTHRKYANLDMTSTIYIYIIVITIMCKDFS